MGKIFRVAVATAIKERPQSFAAQAEGFLADCVGVTFNLEWNVEACF